jgi:hypothetical protein
MQNHRPLDPALLWAQIATEAGRKILNMTVDTDKHDEPEYNWELPCQAHPVLICGGAPYMACVSLAFSYQHPDWHLEIWHGREQLWP